MKEKEIENLYNDLKEEYSKIYNQCKTKILNESINTKEENLRSFEDLDEQEKANIESTTEIQKFMRAFNSKQGTQKMILEKQARKEIQEEQERKKTHEEKYINSLILTYEKLKNKLDMLQYKIFIINV